MLNVTSRTSSPPQPPPASYHHFALNASSSPKYLLVTRSMPVQATETVRAMMWQAFDQKWQNLNFYSLSTQANNSMSLRAYLLLIYGLGYGHFEHNASKTQKFGSATANSVYDVYKTRVLVGTGNFTTKQAKFYRTEKPITLSDLAESWDAKINFVLFRLWHIPQLATRRHFLWTHSTRVTLSLARPRQISFIPLEATYQENINKY